MTWFLKALLILLLQDLSVTRTKGAREYHRWKTELMNCSHIFQRNWNFLPYSQERACWHNNNEYMIGNYNFFYEDHGNSNRCNSFSRDNSKYQLLKIKRIFLFNLITNKIFKWRIIIQSVRAKFNSLMCLLFSD